MCEAYASPLKWIWLPPQAVGGAVQQRGAGPKMLVKLEAPARANKDRFLQHTRMSLGFMPATAEIAAQLQKAAAFRALVLESLLFENSPLGVVSDDVGSVGDGPARKPVVM